MPLTESYVPPFLLSTTSFLCYFSGMVVPVCNNPVEIEISPSTQHDVVMDCMSRRSVEAADSWVCKEERNVSSALEYPYGFVRLDDVSKMCRRRGFR